MISATADKTYEVEEYFWLSEEIEAYLPYVIQVMGPADNFSSQLYRGDYRVASLRTVWGLELDDLWDLFQPKTLYNDSTTCGVLTETLTFEVSVCFIWSLEYTQPGFPMWLNEVKASNTGYRREKVWKRSRDSEKMNYIFC